MSEQDNLQAALPPSAQMFQLILSMMIPPAIHVVAKLGIADVVAKKPATMDELAETTKSSAPSLRRLLQFLTSLGIFSEGADGRYQQTPLSDTLRRDHPQSVRDMAILFGSATLWRSFGELSTTVATGEPAFNYVFGSSFFEYMSAHLEDAAIFNAAMTSISSNRIAANSCGV